MINTLRDHAFPLIGSRRVDDVDVSAIQSLLLPIWLTIPETARRVRQRIFTVLDYSAAEGLLWVERGHSLPLIAPPPVHSMQAAELGHPLPLLPLSELPFLCDESLGVGALCPRR